MNDLLFYVRKPIDNVYYDPRLAASMHLAIGAKDGFKALNHNSGVLFALATENEDGSLNPKCIKEPHIFNKKDGSFGIIAIRTDGEGDFDEESCGCAIVFESRDLLKYKEVALIKLCDEEILDVACEYNKENDNYTIYWCTKEDMWSEADIKDIDMLAKDNPYYEAASVTEVSMSDAKASDYRKMILSEEDFDIEGIVRPGKIAISDEVADRLVKKLNPPVHIGTDFPSEITVSAGEELPVIKATAHYSDGTTAVKRLDIDTSMADLNTPGEYKVTATIHQDHYQFPIANNKADPCIAYWNGMYYFIATHDADKEHSLYVREAKTIPELVDAEEHLIINTKMYDYVGGLLWAPEFHVVNGKMYIYLALTPEPFFCEESHVMELCEGGNPKNMSDWSAPKRVVKADGSDICEMGNEITLDMTNFFWEGDYYAIWSQRQFLPKDLGAWLYIAKVNPKEPWKLLTEPVVLSKPDYGWANNHTFVDEGPFALMNEDKLIITFSSAAVDTSYVVGRFVIEKGKDLLVRDNWDKCNYPILTSRSMEGEFGTGHNAYVIDEYGDIWNTYHARPGVDGPRSSGIRRVHFDIDGMPVLDLTEDIDVVKEHASALITIKVK